VPPQRRHKILALVLPLPITKIKLIHEMESLTQALHALGPSLGTFLFCLLGGIVPIFNTEAFLAALGVLHPLTTGERTEVAVWASLGRVLAKVVMFWGSLGAREKLLKKTKFKKKVESFETKLSKQGSVKANILVFLSALTGFPPLYILTIALGLVGRSFFGPLVAMLLGSFFRYYLVLVVGFEFRKLFEQIGRLWNS
jgi:membrane protein YqaA with SNARE-associated domain